jgi:magnesium transporter
MTTAQVTTTDQLWERWPYLSHERRLTQFRELHTGEKADFFLALSAHDQSTLLLGLPHEQQHVWMRLLAPDDAADLLQEAGSAERLLLFSSAHPKERGVSSRWHITRMRRADS